MLFNEKLYKLRKESGLSQEDLAEKLNTTRQAVSKWENNQGYPETEKLILISNIFNVSVDYLLKDTNENIDINDKGYYASKEMIEEYFSRHKSAMVTACTGLFIILLGVGAYYKFTYESLTPIIMYGLITIGGIIMMKGLFILEDRKFDVLKQEVLIFDKNYQNELKKNYKGVINKLYNILGVSIVIFLVSFCSINMNIEPFIKDFTNDIPITFEIMFLLSIISATLGIYSGVMVEVYSAIVDNEKYINSFDFRFTKKAKIKFENWLK